MRTKRFFIAHAKSILDSELEALRQRCQSALDVLSAGRASCVVTLARDDFNQRWKTAGSWEAWAREVATGTLWGDTATKRYDAIVLVGRKMGNATRRIVQHALSIRKPVLLLNDDQTFTVISCVVERDREDWKEGWEAQ